MKKLPRVQIDVSTLIIVIIDLTLAGAFAILTYGGLINVNWSQILFGLAGTIGSIFMMIYFIQATKEDLTAYCGCETPAHIQSNTVNEAILTCNRCKRVIPN